VQLAELAKLEGAELSLGRTAAPKDVHVGHGVGSEALINVRRNFCGEQIGGVLDQHAGGIQRDVTVTYDRDRGGRTA
jgi:hypothetical protein